MPDNIINKKENVENVVDIVPTDVWYIIISYCKCEKILDFILINKFFKKICSLDELFTNLFSSSLVEIWKKEHHPSLHNDLFLFIKNVSSHNDMVYLIINYFIIKYKKNSDYIDERLFKDVLLICFKKNFILLQYLFFQNNNTIDLQKIYDIFHKEIEPIARDRLINDIIQISNEVLLKLCNEIYLHNGIEVSFAKYLKNMSFTNLYLSRHFNKNLSNDYENLLIKILNLYFTDINHNISAIIKKINTAEIEIYNLTKKELGFIKNCRIINDSDENAIHVSINVKDINCLLESQIPTKIFFSIKVFLIKNIFTHLIDSPINNLEIMYDLLLFLNSNEIKCSIPNNYYSLIWDFIIQHVNEFLHFKYIDNNEFLHFKYIGNNGINIYDVNTYNVLYVLQLLYDNIQSNLQRYSNYDELIKSISQKIILYSAYILNENCYSYKCLEYLSSKQIQDLKQQFFTSNNTSFRLKQIFTIYNTNELKNCYFFMDEIIILETFISNPLLMESLYSKIFFTLEISSFTYFLRKIELLSNYKHQHLMNFLLFMERIYSELYSFSIEELTNYYSNSANFDKNIPYIRNQKIIDLWIIINSWQSIAEKINFFSYNNLIHIIIDFLVKIFDIMNYDYVGDEKFKILKSVVSYYKTLKITTKTHHTNKNYNKRLQQITDSQFYFLNEYIKIKKPELWFCEQITNIILNTIATINDPVVKNNAYIEFYTKLVEIMNSYANNTKEESKKELQQNKIKIDILNSLVQNFSKHHNETENKKRIRYK